MFIFESLRGGHFNTIVPICIHLQVFKINVLQSLIVHKQWIRRPILINIVETFINLNIHVIILNALILILICNFNLLQAVIWKSEHLIELLKYKDCIHYFDQDREYTTYCCSVECSSSIEVEWYLVSKHVVVVEELVSRFVFGH